MAEKTERSLVKKLAEVMAAVERIPKNGVNSNQHYKFVRESDVLDVVRDELSKRKVMCLPRVLKFSTERIGTKSGGEQSLVTLEMEFTYCDGESGESVVTSVMGQGMDSGDKAFFKAMTGAAKYDLMKTFLIPTGDDPENDAEHETEVRATKPREASRPPNGEMSNAPHNTRAPAHDPRTGEVAMVFPNYGRARGMPVKGASFNDLQFYKSGAERSLADPAKSRFHAKEQELLNAINDELGAALQQPTDADAPF